jgi:hypothetical protein
MSTFIFLNYLVMKARRDCSAGLGIDGRIILKRILREIHWMSMGSLQQALVNMIMNLWVPQRAEYLTS